MKSLVSCRVVATTEDMSFVFCFFSKVGGVSIKTFEAESSNSGTTVVFSHLDSVLIFLAVWRGL